MVLTGDNMNHASDSSVWQAKKKDARICPKCKKGHLDERVPRGTLVKTLLFWLPVRRYRCYNCYKKTYILGE